METSPQARNDEATPLLSDDLEGSEVQDEGVLQLSNLMPLIQSVQKDIVKAVDVSMTPEQLRSSELHLHLMRPLLRKYGEGLVPTRKYSDEDLEGVFWRKGDVPPEWVCSRALPYAFLFCRMSFQTEAESDVARRPVLETRAAFAELLAIKILRYYELEKDLPLALTTPLAPTGNLFDSNNIASSENNASNEYDRLCVLEIAIVASAKPFIASSLVQYVLSRLWSGDIVLYPEMRKERAILRDEYKKKPTIEFRTRKSRALPLLDLSRFQIPRFRFMVETIKILTLLVVFLLNLWLHYVGRITAIELIFMLLAASFIQDEILQLHDGGASLYLANQSNTLDVGLSAIFLLYGGIRVVSLIILAQHDADSTELGLYLGKLAFDILSISSVLLFPRVASLYLQRNVIFIAIKAMISNFLVFIVLGVLMAAGFVVSFLLLARGNLAVVGSYEHVLTVCLQVFFGASSAGWTIAQDLHPIIGPPLMLLYAILCQFFLITTLISILSNTFAKVINHSTEELLYSQAIRVFENLQTDPLMLYQPPFNLFVLPLMMPMRTLSALSERNFHRINVALIRFTTFPLLLIMFLWERYERSASVQHGVRPGTNKYANRFRREMTLPNPILPLPDSGLADSPHRASAGTEPFIPDNEVGLIGLGKGSETLKVSSALALNRLAPAQNGTTSAAPQPPKQQQQQSFSSAHAYSILPNLNPFRALTRDTSTSHPADVPSQRLENMDKRLEKMEGMLARLLRNNLPESID